MTDVSSKTELPRCPIGELTPGDAVDSVYLLSSLEQRTKKNGDPYFFLNLADATGQVQAVMWDNHGPLLAGTIHSEDFVRVEGHASEYNGALQMTAKRITRVDDEDVEIGDFLAVSPRPRAEMEAELDELIGQVEHADCKRLLDKMFGHAKFRELFCTAPAAVKNHQAYIGGLLEHTLNVVKNAMRLAETYKPFNADILLTAGLLHDVGKIREYDWRRNISFTDEGRLVGHITIGANMADTAMRQLQREEQGFSEHYRQHILHVILSHHGKMEFGSPVVPKTKEALLLHYADYADAYLTNYANVVEPLQAKGESWSPWNRMFEAMIYAGPSTPPESAGMPPSAGNGMEE